MSARRIAIGAAAAVIHCRRCHTPGAEGAAQESITLTGVVLQPRLRTPANNFRFRREDYAHVEDGRSVTGRKLECCRFVRNQTAERGLAKSARDIDGSGIQGIEPSRLLAPANQNKGELYVLRMMPSHRARHHRAGSHLRSDDQRRAHALRGAELKPGECRQRSQNIHSAECRQCSL